MQIMQVCILITKYEIQSEIGTGKIFQKSDIKRLAETSIGLPEV